MSSLVSVITTVFNGEKYLASSIESILNQTYKNIEFIIVDDGSTDSTAEIVKQYKKIDDRIKLIIKSNTGIYDSMNISIKQSKGDYIAIMDADDISYPERFEKQVDRLTETNADACYTYAEVFGEITDSEKAYHESRYNFDNVTYEVMLSNNHFVANPTLMFTRRFFESTGLYDTEVLCGDWDLLFRGLKNGLTFAVVPEKLLKFRKHSQSVTAASRLLYVESIKNTKLEAAKNYFGLNEKYSIWGQSGTVNYAIWGAGNGGRILCSCIERNLKNWNLKFFIDTYKKDCFLNKEVQHPSEFHSESADFIFITLKDGKEEAVKMLEQMGLLMFKHFMCI